MAQGISNRSSRWWVRVLRYAVCVCVAWLVYQEVMACIPWYFARKMSRDFPRLSLTPRPLSDTSVANLTGMQIERFGCSFQVPWTGLDRERGGKSAVVMLFKSGAGLVLSDPAQQLDIVHTMQKEFAKKGIDFEWMLGRDAVKSNYDYLMASVRMVPAQIHLLASRRSNAHDMILLSAKLANVPTVGNALYEIQQGEMRGIQIGDPSIAPFDVRLELFDERDRHYELWINAGKGKESALVTQPEINAIVRSLHGIAEKEKSPSIAPTVAELR